MEEKEGNRGKLAEIPDLEIKINGQTIKTWSGNTVLEATQALGFDIPTMCHHAELEHHTSCMICLVKNLQNGKLIPSCSTPVYNGMEIVTEDAEIQEARRTGLELLLSDHVGDCEAPCTIACPAHMDIPTMNRLLASGNYNRALEVVKKNIALPSVLGYICPAPCEGACRRKPIDGAVSICLLKRFSGIEGNFNEKPAPLTGQKVAIIGSGPAGLSAAYYLRMNGIQAVIFEKEKQAGGQLRTKIPDNKLPKEALDREIQTIENIGVTFFYEKEIDKNEFHLLLEQYDAIVIASGEIHVDQKYWDIDWNFKGFVSEEDTYRTNHPKVFAIGNALRSSKLAIRSLAQGKEAATAIVQMLHNKPVIGQPMKFNSKFGKLAIPEYAQYLKESVKDDRFEPEKGILHGLTSQEVKKEAARCLHCDCRKIDNCKLREYANRYQANQKRFYYEERKPVRKIFHDSIVYEPEKCIKCGICVRLTEKHQEKYGFTYIGRGFDVEIGIPFNESIYEALQTIAEKVADECPTGALGRK